MSGKLHFPQSSEQDNKAKIEQLGTPATPYGKRRSSLWSARLQRYVAFLLVVLLSVATLIALSKGAVPSPGQANVTRPGTSPSTLTPVSTTSGTVAPTAEVPVQAAQTRLYAFPSNVGLMQPAVDARGNVWVGEMQANRLARLDSRTGVVTTWEPPNGKYGIMNTTIDAQGNAWFVEQGANYIGRFDPVQQAFRIFPLSSMDGRPMGPQALQFDAAGKLWFTAAVGGRIGQLDPTTSAIRTWPVPAPAAGIRSSPFSLTVTPDQQIWFGYLTGGAIGHLDPIAGHVTLYHLADQQATIFSMAHDARGRIWFTEIVPGRLGMIDPSTDSVTELPVPAMSGHPPFLYGLVVTHDGGVWFANNGANALVRYAPTAATYTFFRLSASSGGLYGLALDPAGRLWFTTSGSSTNVIGEMPRP